MKICILFPPVTTELNFLIVTEQWTCLLVRIEFVNLELLQFKTEL